MTAQDHASWHPRRSTGGMDDERFLSSYHNASTMTR